MKFYLVGPSDRVGYYEYDSFVIRAEDERQARDIAVLEAKGVCGAENYNRFRRCKCIELSHEGEAGVILGSFNAG